MHSLVYSTLPEWRSEIRSSTPASTFREAAYYATRAAQLSLCQINKIVVHFPPFVDDGKNRG
jgi:hypothetical protein